MFKEVNTTNDGVMFNKTIHEVLSEPSTSKKAKVRLKIEENVFDLYDSVSDTTKWLSLVSTMVSRMYDIMPEVQKELLNPADRGLIEYALNKFKATTTIADTQLSQEGVLMIDKFLQRQGDLNIILNET